MIKFIGVILNNEIDLNGNQLSINAMKQITKHLKNKLIGFEFNPSIPPIYGIVKGAIYKWEKIIINAEVINPNRGGQVFIVPSFVVKKSHKRGAINILDDVDLLEICLTTQPADRYLTPINPENS